MKGGFAMKLKDKKIEILAKTYVHDKYGNSSVSYQPITDAPLWAYFRQLSARELYGTVTQVEETVLFQITYRSDVTTANTVRYNGAEYEITRIDTFEGYKKDIILYCKSRK